MAVGKALAELHGVKDEQTGQPATTFEDVGREVRVVVTPEQVEDVRMTAVSEKIARRIESELQYPGQIKVVVIRESRAVDFAR